MEALMTEPNVRIVGVEAKTSCGSCGLPVMLNGPLPATPCPHCRNPRRIGRSTWCALLKELEGAFRRLEEGASTTSSLAADDGGAPVELRIKREGPHCPSCGNVAFAEVDVPTRPHTRPCESCGASLRVRPVPEWLHDRFASASALVEADADDAPESVRPDLDSSGLFAMQCPQCSAALEIGSDSTRLLSCSHCGAEVVVPDPVWLELHPVDTVRTWYVRFEGVSPQERAEQKHQARLDKQQRKRQEKDDKRAKAEAAAKEQERAAAQATYRRLGLPVWGLSLLGAVAWFVLLGNQILGNVVARESIEGTAWMAVLGPLHAIGSSSAALWFVIALVCTVAGSLLAFWRVAAIEAKSSASSIPLATIILGAIPGVGVLVLVWSMIVLWRTGRDRKTMSELARETGLSGGEIRRRTRAAVIPSVLLLAALTACSHGSYLISAALSHPNLTGGDVAIHVTTVKNGKLHTDFGRIDAHRSAAGDMTHAVNLPSGDLVYCTEIGAKAIAARRQEDVQWRRDGWGEFRFEVVPERSAADFFSAWAFGDPIPEDSAPGNPRAVDGIADTAP